MQKKAPNILSFFPFLIKDFPELQGVINKILVTSMATITGLTFLFGYFLSTSIGERYVVYIARINASFQLRFDDLAKYDGYSGYYFLSGIVVFGVSSIFVTAATFVAIFRERNLFDGKIYNNRIIIGVVISYLIAYGVIRFMFFFNVGISEQRYVGQSVIFTAIYFPFFLGLSAVFVEMSALFTVAYLIKLLPHLRSN